MERHAATWNVHLGFISVVSLLTLGACDYQHMKNPTALPAGNPNPNLDAASLSFQVVKDQVITPRCLGCHASFADYDTVCAKVDEIRSHALELRDMPKAPEPPLSASEAAVLQAWIALGTPEYPTNPVPSPTPGPLQPTFESLSASIFKTTCVDCHRNGPEAPVNAGDGSPLFFDSEAALIQSGEVVPGDPGKSELYRRVTLSPEVDGHMPDDGPLLSDAELEAIRKWIEAIPVPR